MKNRILSWPYASFALLLSILLYDVADCYDPLDPNGNVTVTFDIHDWTDDGYLAKVTIENFYQYRHVEKPGWKVGWIWADQEVIWAVSGALATKQGNCSSYKNRIPHSCRPDPIIVDLMPDAKPDNRSTNCCRAGVLSGWAIDGLNSFSSFELVVGGIGGDPDKARPPSNLTFMGPGPGYTCGPLVESNATVIPVLGGRREEQVFRTWKSPCTYSAFMAAEAPTCCVSLSSFYSHTITQCPSCSCRCNGVCTRNRTLDPLLTEFAKATKAVQCTEHMCPVRVHWHLQTNYKEYIRVKLTVSNYNMGTNYSDWNLLIQHPVLSGFFTSYSFNSTTLRTSGDSDEVALFWGFKNYNTDLLQVIEDEPGSVMTEMIVRKDANTFTLRNGWAFPRRVYFDGDECVMPLPDEFPRLPNTGHLHCPSFGCRLLFLLSMLVLQLS